MTDYIIPLENILVEHSSFQSNKLRKRLIAQGVKEHKCESCSLNVWLDKPIPLELEHVNGVNDDNRIENLKLLCPNCHALTDTYRGKNRGKAAKKHWYVTHLMAPYSNRQRESA